jgi:cyclopropane fatty-acyl-phospholipid synthase-like methyltransferase
MATRAEIEETYNYMDEIFRESFGEHADLSCAFFDGDLGKTLEQAQRDKHR